MKIIKENNIRWLVVENEENFLYDLQQKSVLDKRLILAKSIDENNVNKYFMEITPEKKEKLEEDDISEIL